MGLLKKFFSNAAKPKGLVGKFVVGIMNRGHAPIAAWGFSHLVLRGDEDVLDCGCGGGANIARFLRALPRGHATGLDYSKVSVEKSRELNAAAIAAGRCEVVQCALPEMPFGDERFDVVTAFETVYFWPDIEDCFRAVLRVLKPGGVFMITNEAGKKTEKSLKWTKIVDGMTIYTAEELEDLLIHAGVARIEMDDNVKDDRLNVRAYK